MNKLRILLPLAAACLLFQACEIFGSAGAEEPEPEAEGKASVLVHFGFLGED